MTIKAAGGVLWRVEDGTTLIGVVHRPRYDDWTLPKGKLDPGEDERAAAVREVREETGASVELGQDLGVMEYVVAKAGASRPKTVRYWSMRYTAGTSPPPTRSTSWPGCRSRRPHSGSPTTATGTCSLASPP